MYSPIEYDKLTEQEKKDVCYKAFIWNNAHHEHVTKLLNIADNGFVNSMFAPCGSDLFRPELWKPQHWKWFMSL